MKLKKTLMAILIILMGFMGPLFACKEKPVTITVIEYESEERITESIKLKIPNKEEINENEENSEEENQTEEDIKNYVKVVILPSAESKIFNMGLDIKVSKNNVLEITKQNETKKGGYVYLIRAIYPENVKATFSTKDGKAKVELDFEISQEIDYIEADKNVNKFIILGENKILNENLIKFFPETTTEREIKYELKENYQGISLIDNQIIFDDPNNPEILLNGQAQTKIYLTAKHIKFNENLSQEEKDKLFVDDIEFDVLYSIGQIVAVQGEKNAQIEISNIDTFASNLQDEKYTSSKISIKRKVEINEPGESKFSYEDINETYRLKYYFLDETNNIINVERDVDPFTLLLTQNKRSGTNTLVVYAQNTIQPEYVSNEIRINIVVKDYPTYIEINGEKNPDEIILYDDGQKRELEIEVGAYSSFDTRFSIDDVKNDEIQLTYANGVAVATSTPLESKTKIYISCADLLNFATDIQGSFTLSSNALPETLIKTIKYRIVKSLKYEDLILNLDGTEVDTQKSLSKTDENGNLKSYNFLIGSKSGVYIPTYKIEIEDNKICKLENIDYGLKTFTIKALKSGSTKLKIIFDNKMQKEITIDIFTPMSSFLVDIDGSSKENLGQIKYQNIDDDKDFLYGESKISSIAMKIDKSVDLKFASYDIKKNLILDNSSIISIKYDIKKNENNITIDNKLNRIQSLKETSSPVKITITAYGYNEEGEIVGHTRDLEITVYIPINAILVDKDYISLMTAESLGDEDEDLSTAEIQVTFNPQNATFGKFRNIKVASSFIYAVSTDIKTQETNNSLIIKIKAVSGLADNQIATGTITLSIQEYNTTYTNEVIVKITKAITPEKVLVENVEQLSDNEGNLENYLYFNLGLSDSIKINPKVYPLNSYNTEYVAKIENSTTIFDPISYNIITGEISPINVGECDLILVPKAFKNNVDYETRIKIRVADGQQIPYSISSKKEFLKLCSTDIVENPQEFEKRFSKKYVLTKNIDLSGEKIYPIGIYKYKNQSNEEVLKLVPFTGSFDGELKIGSIRNTFDLTNLSLDVEFGYSYLIGDNSYLGLFAKNEGEIKNLNLYISPSKVNISSSTDGYISNVTINNKYFIFGAISAINDGKIENCNVNFTTIDVISYYKNNSLGLISGENGNKDNQTVATVTNCYAGGNLNVIDAYKLYNFVNNKNVSNLIQVSAGGLVGKNNVNGKISGNFDFNSINSQIFNKDNINSKVNILNSYRNNLFFTSDGGSYFGGLVGQNEGIVEKISSYSFVYGSNIVGGLVGQNKGTIEGSLAVPCIWSSNIAGGLVGKSESGKITNSAVMLLDDGENIFFDSRKVKIISETTASMLVGELSNTICENNFARSYVIKDSDYYDALVQNGEFFPLYSDKATNKATKNYASNLKYKDKDRDETIVGDIGDNVIIAPTEIKLEIGNSTLEPKVRKKNGFLKLDDDKILLLHYNDNQYNDYISKYIFKIQEIYSENSQANLSLIKIESSNSEILLVDDSGNFTIRNCGEVELRIYSLLNKNAQTRLKIVIINEIDALEVYGDNLKTNLIQSSLFIKKDESTNIYLKDNLLQSNLYLKYKVSSSSSLIINSYENYNDLYFNAQNAQLLKGRLKGTVEVTIEVYVKFGDNYYILPISYSFNVTVKEGLKNLYSSFENATLVQNASLDLELNVITDLVSETQIAIEQFVEDEINNSSRLNCIIDKEINGSKDELTINVKIFVNGEEIKNLVNKTMILKVFVYDNFVTLSMIKQDELQYIDHIKIIKVRIEESPLLSLDLSYFADGEIQIDENGNDIINANELESNFIKIGKMGLLKINAYPIESIKDKDVIITYSNSENYNLNFVQVKKSGNGYSLVNTYSLVKNGIKLDTREENIFDNFLFVRLLTDSPININSEFKLKIQIGNNGYYYEKNLLSKLASNLEISYANSVFNKDGYLEGVYAKGVEKEQLVSLFVNKLNNFTLVPSAIVSGDNKLSVNLNLVNTIKIDDDITRYDFSISGLENAGESVTIQFYVDKFINSKKERYLSTKLKLNVVDFVVTKVNILDCDNGYISKPLGSKFGLRVQLDTINNKDTNVLKQIALLENNISKSNVWKYDNKPIVSNEYYDITKEDGYYTFSAKNSYRLSGFGLKFRLDYTFNEDNNPIIKISEVEDNKSVSWIYEKNIATKFVLSFGINSYIQTDKSNPVPIYTQNEFENMQEGNNYILLNNLELNDYVPLETVFESFDGNGCTIKINNFAFDDSTSEDEVNFGLFSKISENSLVKNVTLEFGSKENSSFEINSDGKQLNFENTQTLRFGAIAGINNGLIYNSYVKSFKLNNAENIVYINLINILSNQQTKGYIGGFVGQNNGVITNSRSELKISSTKGCLAGFVSENNGMISSCYVKNALIKNFGEDETTSNTSGFVNKNAGKVKYCFIEGDEKVADSYGRYQTDGLLGQYCLQAPTSVGGFVYENLGEIEDCYSNLSITSQSYSGGFAFSSKGKIIRCYSACINEQENNIAHAPFMATKTDYNVENLKNNIVNCYYLNINKTSINDDIVKPLSFDNFKNSFYFTDYIFNKESIWMMTEKLPTLIEANNIAVSKRVLASTEIMSTGSVKYNYSYTDYYFGHKQNPIIISNEDEFIYYFENNNMINNYYYRIINNINFSSYSNLPTTETVFGGVLDGNGLEITNLSISASANYNGDSFGLFAKIMQTNREGSTLVKNLSIKPSEVYANNVSRVGTLAGEVVNASVFNVKVEALKVVVQGANIVGGVVGKVKGNSNLVGIESNISVNANHQASKTNIYVAELQNEAVVSYAGAICGLVDVNQEAEIMNIKVNSGSVVIGNFVGFAFGGVMKDSSIVKVEVSVNSSQYLNANYCAGIVAGENRGYLSTIETKNESKNEKLFRNNSYFVGGVVGFNNTGTIVNAILKADVQTDSITNIAVGGVAGLSIGGKFSSIYTNMNLYSPKSVGGIVGFATIKENIVNSNERKIDNYENFNPTSKIIFINNCVMHNKVSANTTYLGSLFGVVHNKTELTKDGVSLEKEFGYIVENSYYVLDIKDSQEETESLSDFGASGGGDLSATNVIVAKDLTNNLAKNVEKIELSHFITWSKALFELNSKEDQISLSFKNTNNVNLRDIEGDGTFANPYTISSMKALKDLAQIVKESDRYIYVKLADNIDATGEVFETISNGRHKFNGTFDGDNYYISGLSYETDTNNISNYYGLFGYVDTMSVVRNLNVVADFEICYGTKIQYTGVIAGYNKGYIKNCKVYGGISAKIENIESANAQSTNTSFVGLIAGVNDGNRGIEECETYATVVIKAIKSENLIDVSNIKIYAGLIVGVNQETATVNKCFVRNRSNGLLNAGMKYYNNETLNDYFLVVQNIAGEGCENQVGKICGYNVGTIFNNDEDLTNIYNFIY